jgi:uncharacterized membrane protein
MRPMPDLGGYGTLAAILAMGAITYAMRAGGFWLMAHVPLTARVRRILDALPGTVVVATVLPLMVREGLPAALAIAAAGAAMLIRRNDFLAVLAGMAAAIAARAWLVS